MKSVAQIMVGIRFDKTLGIHFVSVQLLNANYNMK